MHSTPRYRWAALLGANAVALCMLGFYGSSSAQQAQQAPNLPFANSVEQTDEIIQQLKQLNGLMREQNNLLRSGQLQVVVSDRKRP